MFLDVLVLLLIIALLCLACVVMWLWMLIDCLSRKTLSDMQRAVWALVIVVVGPIGALIYFLFGRTTTVSPQYMPYQARRSRQAATSSTPVYYRPRETYQPYQEGYRQQDVPHSYRGEQAVSNNRSVGETPAVQGDQYEQMQVLYPEE